MEKKSLYQLVNLPLGVRLLVEVTVCVCAPDSAGGLKGYLGCLFIRPDRAPPRWEQDSVSCEPIPDSSIRTEQAREGKQGF